MCLVRWENNKKNKPQGKDVCNDNRKCRLSKTFNRITKPLLFHATKIWRIIQKNNIKIVDREEEKKHTHTRKVKRDGNAEIRGVVSFSFEQKEKTAFILDAFTCAEGL